MEPNCNSKSRKKYVSIKKYKVVRAVVLSLCMMILAITIVPAMTAYAAEDQDDSYDLEAVSNALGTIMSLGTMPIKETVTTEGEGGGETHSFKTIGISVIKGAHDNKNAGNAGLTLVFSSYPTSLGTWVSSKISASSNSYDYDGLLNIRLTDGTRTPIIYQYAVYGRLLNQLGLDKTAISATGGLGIGRVLSGVIMWILYVLASLINQLFVLMLQFLQILNPFSWLEAVAKNASANLGMQYSATDIDTGIVTDVFGFDDILQYIAAIYVSMCNLSWAFMIPMSVALYLANMFLFRKTAGGKRLIKKIIFIAIGVPLVGSTYTSFLNEMQSMFKNTTSNADGIVASTFVDFEGWAANTHLAVPDRVGGENYNATFSVHVPVTEDGRRTTSLYLIGGNPTAETQLYLQDACAAINYMTYSGDDNSTFGTGDFESGIQLDMSTNYDTDADTTDSTNIKNADDILSESEFNINHVTDTLSTKKGWVINLLNRYISGDTYSAEQFASSIQSRMSSFNNDGDITAVGNMMMAASRYKNYKTYEGEDTKWGKIASIFSADSNKLSMEEAAYGSTDSDTAAYAAENITANRDNAPFGNVNIFNDGGLKCSSDYLIYTYSSEEVCTPYAKDRHGIWKDFDEPTRMGLSTMSMYNYLRSDFTTTGVITYGGGNAITNGLTSAKHYSVNLIGTGYISFFYWFSSAVLLFCITIIGILYSFSMFVGTAKYTFKTIGAMPMAVLGSMRYIAKFVGMACAMIMNIVVTALMYGVVIEVILAIYNILTKNPALLVLAQSFGATGILLVGNLLVPIILIWLTVILLRIRSSAVNSITEWITQIVGKFFEADGHADPSKNKGNIGQKVASGLATGAALAGGHGMLKAASAVGGALSGGNESSSDDNSGDNSGGGNNSVGGGIEKEVNSDHNNSHDGTNKETAGGKSQNEKETKDAKVDKENANVDKENSSALSRDAQNNDSTVVGTASATHDSKDSQNATHASEESKSSTDSSDESTSATHDSDEKADNREARAESAAEHEKANATQSSVSKMSESAAVKEAVEKDTTGTADVVKQNVDAVNKAGQNLEDAGKSLSKGDLKGAAEDVKSAGKNVAGAAVADAIVATTGNVKAASAAGHLTDDAANGNLKAGSVLKGAAALGGANNSVVGQMPSQNTNTDGSKNLGGKADNTSGAPHKSLTPNDSGTGSTSGTPTKSLNGSGAGSKPNDGNVRSTQHTMQASAGGMTLNSNITNNITNGGTINNTQQAAGGGNGHSLNMTNNASVGGNVNNTTNNNGGNVNNSAGRNVTNVTNVNNGSGNTAPAPASGGNGGKNVTNVTNVNNARTVNNATASSQTDNRHKK